MLLADVVCHVVVIWLTFVCHCGRWNSHISLFVEDEEPHLKCLMIFWTVADGIATIELADVIAIVVDGITTLV